MKIVTLLGTARPGNYTQHALQLVETHLKNSGVSATRFDPSGKVLPFPGQEGDFPDAQLLQDMVRDATGIIIATPEYHGSFSALLKLMLENMGFPSLLAGKPVALLGVAAGRIGAIKSLEQLRSVCSHTGAIVLPGPVSIAGIQQVFDAEGNCTSKETQKSLEGVATRLLDYLNQHVCPRFALEAMVRS